MLNHMWHSECENVFRVKLTSLLFNVKRLYTPSIRSRYRGYCIALLIDFVNGCWSFILKITGRISSGMLAQQCSDVASPLCKRSLSL